MKTILLIDDEEQVRKALRELLLQFQFEVLEAENGAEGIKLYTENSVDVIITDLVMPEMDGLETIQAIKQQFPEAKIIAISGGIVEYENSVNVILPLAIQAGASQIIRKPCEIDELLDAIQEVLAEKTESLK